MSKSKFIILLVAILYFESSSASLYQDPTTIFLNNHLCFFIEKSLLKDNKQTKFKFNDKVVTDTSVIYNFYKSRVQVTDDSTVNFNGYMLVDLNEIHDAKPCKLRKSKKRTNNSDYIFITGLPKYSINRYYVMLYQITQNNTGIEILFLIKNNKICKVGYRSYIE